MNQAHRPRPLRDQLTAPGRYTKTDEVPAGQETPATTGELPIILFTRAADPEAHVLATMLASQSIPSMAISFEALSSATFDMGIPAGSLRLGGLPMRPSVAWIRHFSPTAVPITGDPVLDRFRAESLSALLSQIHLACDSVINPRHAGLLEQLSTAASLGIPVPPTKVFSGPPTDGLLGWNRVVVKTLSPHFVEIFPGHQIGAFPEIMSRAEFLAADFADSPPVVVQEFIEHEDEYRVYAVHGQVIAYRISKPRPSALWLDEAEVAVIRCEPPDCVAVTAMRLMNALQLDYAALDFLVAGDRAVFLEANLDGDWLWFEHAAHDTSVTKAVLSMLWERRSRACAGPHQAEGAT